MAASARFRWTGITRQAGNTAGIGGGHCSLVAGRSHRPAQQGGRNKQNVKEALLHFYLGGAAAWDHRDVTEIDANLRTAVQGAHNGGAALDVCEGAWSEFQGGLMVPGGLPQTVSRMAVEGILRELSDRGQFKRVDLVNHIICLLLPTGIFLEDAPFVSQPGLDAIHGRIAMQSGTTIRYVAVVYPEFLADGRANGRPSQYPPWRDITKSLIREARALLDECPRTSRPE